MLITFSFPGALLMGPLERIVAVYEAVVAVPFLARWFCHLKAVGPDGASVASGWLGV